MAPVEIMVWLRLCSRAVRRPFWRSVVPYGKFVRVNVRYVLAILRHVMTVG